MSLTERLAALIRAKPIGADDLDAAALFTLDAIANAIAGRNTDPGRVLSRWASAQGRDAGRLAMLMGGMTHVLETDDLHRASVTHPGCVVVPAATAVAERQGCDGVDFLTAILQGFEAMCRVGNAVGSEHYRVWHNTATCGPYGSAMAAGHLLALDEVQMMHALGNAGTQSSGLWQFLVTGAMSKHLHAGRAAEAGVIAADLALAGFTGPPEILEGEKGFFAGACPDAQPAAVLADAGDAWQLRQTSIKPWPCCRHTHPCIDAALSLHRQLADAEISSVEVATYQAAIDVCDRPEPDSPYEAKFSLQHCVAAAIQQGQVDFDSFDAAARDRAATLRRQVTVSASEPWVSAYPRSWGAAVTVELMDGRRLSESRDGAKGDPEHALGDGEMLDKAGMLMQFGGCTEKQANTLSTAILDLPDGGDCGKLVHELCALMWQT